jgi:hypothetical protein
MKGGSFKKKYVSRTAKNGRIFAVRVHKQLFKAWSQSCDRELQLQRCKNL